MSTSAPAIHCATVPAISGAMTYPTASLSARWNCRFTYGSIQESPMKKVKLLAKYCSIARPMGMDRSMSDSPIPDTGRTTFKDFLSPGPPGGESWNHSSQNTAHSNPIPPRIQNDVRHCHRVSIHASSGKDTAPPNLEP